MCAGKGSNSFRDAFFAVEQVATTTEGEDAGVVLVLLFLQLFSLCALLILPHAAAASASAAYLQGSRSVWLGARVLARAA